MARLRHQQFASVHEVNQAMAPLLTRLNDKAFQKLPGSRASTFAEIDAPALLPLPLQRYEMDRFKTAGGTGIEAIGPNGIHYAQADTVDMFVTPRVARRLRDALEAIELARTGESRRRQAK